MCAQEQEWALGRIKWEAERRLQEGGEAFVAWFVKSKGIQVRTG
jgi:hypothetical protein